MSASNYDVVVVGGGAAGLSAALVLGRARRRVAVIDAGTPRNAPAAHMHGFLSRDGLPPAELLSLGREEVARYGVMLAAGTVSRIAAGDAFGFRVVLQDGRSVEARRLLLTTGLRDELPEIPGLRERWAKDVLHCPYCHGYEVRDQALAVLGGSPAAVRYAQIVRQWSDTLTYVAAAASLSPDERLELEARAINIVVGTVEHLHVNDDRLQAIELDGNRIVPCDALFVPPRFVPHNELLAGLGCDLDADGWPVTRADGQTTVSGVWAAGNLADPRAQVITAAGQGSAAAIAINADLVEEDVRTAVQGYAPERNLDPTDALEEQP